jgi:hypothetical protein
MQDARVCYVKQNLSLGQLRLVPKVGQGVNIRGCFVTI